MRALIVLLACLLSPLVLAKPFSDAAELQEWLNENIESVVQSGGASAAAVAVVQGGEVLLAENYGWYEPVEGVPVTDNHQFKIGSITKTFTGLTVAYLVDQGLIASVDEPANKYLKRYQLSGEWGEQVTIAHLLTHSAGLDSPALGITADDQIDIPASSEFLEQRLPPIVREPGTRIGYANYGMAIVQALVEDVTGQRFDHYIRDKILLPLGMKESVLGVDRTGGPSLVKAGRTSADGAGRASTLLPLGTNAPFVATSGAMQVTTPDMARYMNGQLGFAPNAITPGMLAEQQRAIRSNHAGLADIGLALFGEYWNGVRLWSHGGLVAGFRSDMVLVPELKLGVYVAFAGGSDVFNAAAGNPGDATMKLLQLALGDYQRPVPLVNPSDVGQYVGTYWNDVRAHSTPDMLVSLMQTGTITLGSDGKLYQRGQSLVEIAPGLFMAVDKEHDGLPPRFVAMNGDEVLSNAGFERRVSGMGNPQNWLILINVSLVLCLTGLLALFYRKPLRTPTVIVAVGAASFVGLVAIHMLGPNAFFEIFTAEIMWRFRIGTTLAWLLPLLSLWCVYAAIRSWAGATRLSQVASIHTVVVGTAAMILGVMLHVLQFT